MGTKNFRKAAILLLAVTIFSCNQYSAKDQATIEQKSERNNYANTELKDSTGAQTGMILQGSAPGINPDWDKKIIKTANLTIEVKDFKSFSDLVHKSSKQFGGYIASEEQSESDGKLGTTISIKVPVDQFESLVNQFPSSEKLIEKNITTEDVTGEVVDTKSRLEAKEQMRLKYLEFLKQSKNMDEVLKVQNEINNIQEQIESASGRINYLSHQSAFSTVNLTFYQLLPGYNPSPDDPGFLSRTADAFKKGFSFIGEIFIGFVSIWPLILTIVAIWILWKRRSIKVIPVKQNIQ